MLRRSPLVLLSALILTLGACTAGNSPARTAAPTAGATTASATVAGAQPSQPGGTIAAAQPSSTRAAATATRIGVTQAATQSSVATSARPAASSVAASAVSRAGDAAWTLLIYIAANNNLEYASLTNLQQLVDANSSPRIHVIVQVTRDPSSEYTDAIANLKAFTTTKRLEVQHGRFVERADLGRVNSGDAATLADFIDWGQRSYPAQHYLLAISDHGGAWEGCCQDDTFHSFMNLAGIQRALKAATKPFDIIGFDACLMANLEVALALQPYASLVAASEESEPALGWDYTGLLNAMVARPEMTPLEAGRAIADTYLAGLKQNTPDEALYATFSVVDLTQLGAVSRATTAFMSAVGHYVNDGTQANSPERLTRIGQVFLQAESETAAFGTSGPGDLGSTIDLGLLAKNAATESSSLTLQQAARDVQQALGKSVTYSVAGPGYASQPPAGLSLATLAAGDTHTRDLRAYAPIASAQQTGWLPLVQEFDSIVATAASRDVDPSIAGLQVSTRTIANGETATVRGQVRDDLLVTDVKVSVATMLNGNYVQLSQDNRERRLGKRVDVSYDFDGRSWYISDSHTTELIYSEDFRPGQRIVYGLYRQRPSDDGGDAYMVIDEASGRIVQAFDLDAGLGLLGALIPGARSTFTPYLYDANDYTTAIPLSPVNLKTAKLTRVRLPAGTYDVIVDADNISANSVSESVSVTLTGR